jgi:thiol-disulfide isomerase/thioredoxin
MDKTLKTGAGVVIAAAILCAVVFFLPPQLSPTPAPAADASVQGAVTVYFFYGEECPHCHTVLPFVESLRQKYPEVNFRILETWHNATNLRVSQSLHQALGLSGASVPEVIIGNVSLVGDREIPARLESVIVDALKKKP